MASSPAHQTPTYSVEHLATFSTTSPQQQQTTPKMALQRLFAMEKTSGIWTQRMALQLKGNHMWILDGESNDVVERFPVSLIQSPTPFNDHNHIYNNILIFTVQLPNENQGELHIFQCVSHNAIQIVEDIQQWMRHYGANNHNESSAQPNVSVKETVNVFNKIAAQREIKPSSPTGDGQTRLIANYEPDSRSITTTSSIDSSHHNGTNRTGSHDQSLNNERYVSILNHCFDDIERFIIRLQHAAAALRELQLRNHRRQGKGAAHAGDGLLAMRARGPNESEFFEILSKFKLAFNLLAKLKGCIHDPNAPELVHFLFTPLAIIIEAARSNEPPIDPSIVGVPFLNYEAIDLLSNCCTSKEFDLWQSLGPNWVQPIKHNTRHSSSYQPVFTDGWAPNITEPELIGIASESEQEDDSIQLHRDESNFRNRRDVNSREYQRGPQFDDSDIDDNIIDGRHIQHRISPSTSSHATRVVRGNTPPSPIDSIERDSPTVQVNELDQSEWLAELTARNAKIVRVLFPRTANNDKELTVIRGEILEILDDSRKWWKARNWRGQVAHVPHTIVSEIPIHMTNGRDRHLGSSSPNDDWVRRERQVNESRQQNGIQEVHKHNHINQTDIIPTDVADDMAVQRLHSNLLIVKNLHSYAPINAELNSKLKERLTLYDPQPVTEN
ncbi:epidermal growth factor receptor kinase substrate 8-like protein 1 isoform X2 [Oppia nitens]|uniref:epidermal growth factor receptor kinase substrate 8-like protein 1 isoform X2 n=1 Tax=Oppia nitens TaxID=1686743 RepID=UPI0023DAC756|nr:epidermal growth factor receptor kinase substrate 8-like protein 1 isoform X2 [Oppia nitens]